MLLTIPHPSFANHNGGRIDFGPDGYLYIGTGDGGSGGDPNDHGQSLERSSGKMLRIDVDHPAGKPYADSRRPTRSSAVRQAAEIFAYGLRNPYSFSFDRLTGDLWIGDVGQDQWEEVDRAPAAEGGGNGVELRLERHGGQPLLQALDGLQPGGLDARRSPNTPTAPTTRSAAPSSAATSTAARAHPELSGRYFFGDECSGHIWDVAAAGPASADAAAAAVVGAQHRRLGRGVAGELYVVASNGTLYQLT